MGAMLSMLLRSTRNRLRAIHRTASWQWWKPAALVAFLLLLEVCLHVRNYAVPRPAKPVDAPFYTGCQDPVLNTTERASAVLVMLARNTEIDGAIASVRSVQEQFNDNFGYPWVFLNDVEWSSEFKQRVGQAVGKAIDVKFEQIPQHMWGYPDWLDQKKAKASMREMKQNNIQYGGAESYHHMCRFQSGFFYDHPALLPYRYYWRVEPNIRFTCALTYDPFVAMKTHNKRYGYNMALWERGQTVPSLFRKISDYKVDQYFRTTALWTAMLDASYMPWPFRGVLAMLRNRDGNGDLWNVCHFWSNFEIADLDFYRSDAYRNLFDYLDRDGGFYYERWGDAAVHSLAAAMLLEPQELHHFSDLGYVHDGLQYCTFQSTPKEKRKGYAVPPGISGKGHGKIEGREEVGCRCKCDPNLRIVEPVCLNQIGLALA
ncbi:Putative glycosyl transferase, family 15, nucleotide-diphospho-sugar transferase [Septoria linicola]|uniref:Glycosyl transferase, family 15, nucleotide-diphospho-sugar transferase n=1 Tax=Septoria linicola TaxID=215465 RepID=A0A9Q9AII7_9PEZI|nr:putative glycosyl transferase, family 15, nucleotide-diphospho-sugar transferase [Septoria linicola]USW46737.1 Putative glycosyl transferase, family 15, nucleotide-diphospho-sugar transferase [Septoria linicola]